MNATASESISHSLGLRACATILASPPSTYLRIEETVVPHDDAVVRTINASVDLRQADGQAASFLLPLATPFKGTLVRLENVRIDGKRAALVGYDQQTNLARDVLRHLFVVATAPGQIAIATQATYNRTSARHLAALDEAERRLYSIVEARPEEAAQTLVDLFDETGGLKALPSEYRPWEPSIWLHRVARLVASRYIVACSVSQSEQPETIRNVSYSMTQPLRASDAGPLDRIRTYLQTQRQTLTFHTPLAKATSAYYFDFVAPTDYYVHNFSLLALDRPTEPSDTASAHYRDARNTPAKNVDENSRTWTARLGNGTDRVRLFVRGGDAVRAPLLVGVRLLEKPPGAWSSVLVMSGMSLLVGVCFVIAALLFDADIPDSASALATVLVAIPMASGLVVARPTRRTTPLRSRVFFAGTFVMAALLCFWILAQRDNDDLPMLVAAVPVVFVAWFAFAAWHSLRRMAVEVQAHSHAVAHSNARSRKGT